MKNKYVGWSIDLEKEQEVWKIIQDLLNYLRIIIEIVECEKND